MHMNDLLIRKIKIDWNKINQNSYLHAIPSIQMNELSFHSPITFFVGENGSGKSTLLEAIAVAYGFNPEGGTRNYSFSTYDSHSSLCHAITFEKGVRKCKWGYFLRAESFYNVATKEDEYGHAIGGVPHDYHQKSHGESFLEVMQDNLSENSIYFLDEPEAALSTQRQLSLLIEIDRYASKGAQFVIVTHSPILLGIPNATILSFDDGVVHEISYEQTSSYQITNAFLRNREKMLKELLDDEKSFVDII